MNYGKVSGHGVLALLIFVSAGVGGFAYSFGTGQGIKHEAARVNEERGLERRVMDVVVKRNPAATVRDFGDFPGHLLAASSRFGLDFRLVLALIDLESEFKPGAVGAKGEIGLMQVMPTTAADVVAGLEMKDYEPPSRAKTGGYVSLGTLGDPKLNVLIGLAYLARMRDQFGPGPTMLQAYNRGPGKAHEHRPEDRYAEKVALKFFTLTAAEGHDHR